MTEAERKAWNEAIEAAVELALRHHVLHMTSLGRNPEDYISNYWIAADDIRSLTKQEPRHEG